MCLATFGIAYDAMKPKLNNLTRTLSFAVTDRGTRPRNFWALKKKQPKKHQNGRRKQCKTLLTHCFNHVITPEEVDLSPLPVI